MRRRTSIAVGVLMLIALAGVGARCIEHTSVQVDGDGDTHIYGEMVNETTIHGRNVVVRGRLLDATGGVVAQADALLCPPDLTPGTSSVIDVPFEGAPPHASFDVQPIAGAATDIPLPFAEIRLIGASTFPERGLLYLRMDVQNIGGRDYGGINACLAAYDDAGVVVAASTREIGGVLAGGGPAPVEDRLLVPIALADLSPSAEHVRGWIWLADASGAQAYQPVMTDLVPIAR